MALQFMEGFGAYETGTGHTVGDASDLKIVWDWWSNPVTLTTYASDTNGIRNYATWATDGHLEKFLPTRLNRLILGFRIYRTTSADNLFCMFWGEGEYGRVGCRSDGRLVYHLGTGDLSAAGFVAISDDPVPVNEYVYIEIDVTFHDTAGACAFYINGGASGSFTNIDTMYRAGTGYCGKIIFGGYSGDVHDSWQSTNRITDIYVDSTTRLGQVEVWYQKADTVGTAAAFTPSAGSNYQNVDDIGSDEDTTYNYSTAATKQDDIAHSQTLSEGPYAIQPVIMARSEGPGTAIAKVGVRSSTTEVLSTDRPLSPGIYSGRVGAIYTDDPATATSWTAGGADAAETLYAHTG